MDIIKKFWTKIKEVVKGSIIAQIVIVILILLLVYWLYKKYFVKAINTQSEAEKVAQQTQSQPSTSNQSTTNLADQARNLSIHLGTNKDLRWWETQTENDEGVYNILRSMDLTQFKTVSEVYRQVFTENRDLKADVIRFLDADYLEKLSHLFGGSNVGGFFAATSLNNSDTLLSKAL